MRLILAAMLACGLASASAAETAAPASSAPSPPTPAAAAPANAAADDVLRTVNDATLDTTGRKDGVDPAVLRAEIMLDRLHVSPGVIDGKPGSNFTHALETFEAQNKLPHSKGLDKPTWDRLVEEAGQPVLVDHVLTDADVAGPFFPDLPKNYAILATMKTLGYRSVAQKLGAMFHMSEGLLAALNPGVDLGKAGNRILVADPSGPQIRGRLARIFVDKRESQVLGYDREGHVLIEAPATIGSRELPSPSGAYKVKGVSWNPIYYYNPKNFVQGHNEEKLRLPPGPNTPVGDVFIALTKPTYGLHGTPDPSAIDKTASHGCVRMTNWDAVAFARLVHPGVPVRFGRSKARTKASG